MMPVTGALGAALLALGPHGSAPLAGQSSELVMELGATWSLPPTGVDGDAAGFFVAGLRGGRWGAGGSGVHASALVGRSMDRVDAGDVASGEVGGTAWRRFGGGWTGGLRGRAFGFRIDAPVEQLSGGAEASMVLRWSAPAFQASVTGTGGVGRSRLKLTIPSDDPDRPDRIRERTDDLWRYGSDVELLWGDGPVLAGVGGGLHRGAAGTYSRAGVALLAGVAGRVVELRVERWDTPTGAETTGGLAFHLPVAGWSARGSAGRPDPDPLLRDEPGRGVGGLLVGRRLLGPGYGNSPLARSERTPLHTILEETPEGATVRIEVVSPDAAGSVTLLGDFTLWEEITMERSGERWTVDVEVPVGTHHFGFMVDDEWFVPEDAPDAVPDEWGRRSLTLVVGAGMP